MSIALWAKIDEATTRIAKIEEQLESFGDAAEIIARLHERIAQLEERLAARGKPGPKPKERHG